MPEKLFWLVIALGLIGLGLGLVFVAPRPGGEVLQSARPRASAPTVPPEDLQSVVEGNTAFALALYRELGHAEGNLFFSPHSLSVALAMTYAGARGETGREMALVLGIGLPQDRLHRAFNALDQALAPRAAGIQLTIANALWGGRGYPFRQEYLDLLAENYGAGVRLLDFARAPEAARREINRWVTEQTRGRIQDLVPPGAITPATALVLTNAIHFLGVWEEKFEHAGVQPFQLLDGRTVPTPMMRREGRFRYASGEGYQAVELPYAGGELAMLLVLPEPGRFLEFERGLSPQVLAKVVAALEPRSVEVVMPKFSFSSGFSLREVLSRLGMERAFTGGADFSGIDGGGLFLTDVFHKAFVSVSEEGTEAAAATAVIVGRALALEFRADRPFLFAIRHRGTGTLLFLGRLVDPSK